MSGNEKKREQAQKLLRSMTDIDDRFLEEVQGTDKDPEQRDTSGQEGTSERGSGSYGKRNRRIRTLSRWALTAAACLTVALVGRYVVIHQNANQSEEKAVTAIAGSEVQDRTEEHGMKAAEEEEVVIPEGIDAAEEAGVMQDAEVVEDAEVSDMAAMDSGTAYESAQIANPWIDAESLEEAEEAAGFTIGIPEAEEPYTTLIYRAMEGEMLEIIFVEYEGSEEGDDAEEDDDGNEYKEGFRIRKARGEDDISGDYNTYAEGKIISLEDGTKVTLRGNRKDSWSVAVWTVLPEEGEETQAYSYAIDAGEKQFSTAEIRKLAEQMMDNEKASSAS